MKAHNCIDCFNMRMVPNWNSSKCVKGHLLRKPRPGEKRGYPKTYKTSPGKQWYRAMKPRADWEYAKECVDYDDMDGD